MDQKIVIKELEAALDDEIEAAHSEARRAVNAIIELAGTHTSSTATEADADADADVVKETEVEAKANTDTEAIITAEQDMLKHVSFEAHVTTQASLVVEKVKEIEKEIEREEITRKTMSTMAKKRKRNSRKQTERCSGESEGESESVKRMRSDYDELSMDDIIIEEHDTNEFEVTAPTAATVGREQLIEKPIVEENQDIAERFKQIMEMFDNFTKNLESLEMTSLDVPSRRSSEETVQEAKNSVDKNESLEESANKNLKEQEIEIVKERENENEKDSDYDKEEFDEDREERECLLKKCRSLLSNNEKNSDRKLSEEQKPFEKSSVLVARLSSKEQIAVNASRTEVKERVSSSSVVLKTNDYIIDMEDLLRPEGEQFELLRLQEDDEHVLPKWRQGLQRSPLLSVLPTYKDTATCTHVEENVPPPLSSVSCQTSLFNQHIAIESLPPTGVNAEPNKGPCIIDVNTHQQSASYDSANTRNIETDCRVETFLVTAPPLNSSATAAAVPTTAMPPVHGMANVSISRQTLIKVSESPSMLELPVMSQPHCGERTFHTIHIDTTSSPSSSVMRRPPLCLRCWHVLTDLFNAICMCLNVNKDCIFCLGFFVAFVVSASFLTAFFYRTLSISPQLYHPTPTPVQLAVASRDGNFYYY